MKISYVTVELMVRDITATIDFYQKMLDFELLQAEGPEDHPHWALMQLGPFRLSMNQEQNMRDAVDFFEHQQIGGTVALCFEVDDLHGYYDLIKSRSLLLEHPHLTPCGSHQFSLLDNNGYVIVVERFEK